MNLDSLEESSLSSPQALRSQSHYFKNLKIILYNNNQTLSSAMKPINDSPLIYIKNLTLLSNDACRTNDTIILTKLFLPSEKLLLSSTETKSANVSEVADLDENVELNEMEKRYYDVQREFPNFNLKMLESKRFILVSFGSVAKVCHF